MGVGDSPFGARMASSGQGLIYRLAPEDKLEELKDLTGITVGGSLTQNSDFNAITTPSGWANTLSGGGTNTNVLGISGGVSRLARSAGAGAVANQRPISTCIADASLEKWAFATRARFPLAQTANVRTGQGLINTALTRTIMVGTYGNATVAANFAVQFDGLRAGSFLDLGVAVDTGFHVFTMWSRGDGRIYGYCDSAPVASAAITLSMVDSFGNREAFSAVNEDAQIDSDWFVYLHNR